MLRDRGARRTRTAHLLTGNRALTGFTAPKLLWLRKHVPEIYERIHRIVLPKDYVRLQMTGEWAIDVADASGTLLFDVANRRWDSEVLSALDIPAEWLPPVAESTEVAGAGDQQAAALGVGVVGARHGLGRARHVGRRPRSAPKYAHDRQARVHAFCHALPDTWEAMGVMLNAAGSLRWFRDAFAPGCSFDELTEEAARWEDGPAARSSSRISRAKRTPHADSDARGAFVGLSLLHDRGALVRSVLEGVAYGLRDSLELLRDLGVQPRAGRASGGGAHSRLWLEIVASVLDLPLERSVVDEGSAYGAALLAGVAGGTFSSAQEAVSACVRVRETVEPNAPWARRYADGYARYRALYPASRSLEERMKLEGGGRVRHGRESRDRSCDRPCAGERGRLGRSRITKRR